jgi:non-ribosomal peptide synthase protein (TIGR01720 family)
MRDANIGARHPDNRRRYVIDIDCLVRQGALTCTFTYPGTLMPAASIEELVTGFRNSLEALIAHCLSPDAGGRSASDFALAGLDADEFAKLNELLGG